MDPKAKNKIYGSQVVQLANSAAPKTPTILQSYNSTPPKKSKSLLPLISKQLAIGLVAFVVLGTSVLGLIINSHKKQPASPSVLSKTSSLGTPSTVSPPASSPSSTPSPSPASTPTPPKPSTSPAPTKSTAPTAQAAVPPNCTKPSFAPIDALAISTSSPGLKQVIDLTNYYTVYGYTANEIRSQLNQCSPATDGGKTFDANTTWWFNFSYLYDVSSGSTCYIHNVAVGLHVKRTMPAWQSSSQDGAGLASKWQTYVANLNTHEQGHVSLAQQYASTLLSDLQNYPQTSCSSIVQSVNTYGSSIIAQANQAEANYDIQTNHGATQGAVFP